MEVPLELGLGHLVSLDKVIFTIPSFKLFFKLVVQCNLSSVTLVTCPCSSGLVTAAVLFVPVAVRCFGYTLSVATLQFLSFALPLGSFAKANWKL